MILYFAVSRHPSLDQFKTNAEADDADKVEEKKEKTDWLSARVADGTLLKTSDERHRVFESLQWLKLMNEEGRPLTYTYTCSYIDVPCDPPYLSWPFT